jgi:hypothetical protein
MSPTLSDLATMSGWVKRDLTWLAPPALGSAAACVVRGLWSCFDAQGRVATLLLVEIGAYVAVYLPWGALVERYAAGLVFSLALLCAMETTPGLRAASVPGPPVARAVLVFDGLTDDAAMVAAVARTAPRDATVVFDVDRAQKELAFGTAVHLPLWHGRGDVRVAVPGVSVLRGAADPPGRR